MIEVARKDLDARIARMPPEYAADVRAATVKEDPDRVWMKDEDYAPLRTKWGSIKGKPGLGDIVAKIAQPIAKATDAVAGTKLRKCGRCRRWQAALNKAGQKLGL